MKLRHRHTPPSHPPFHLLISFVLLTVRLVFTFWLLFLDNEQSIIDLQHTHTRVWMHVQAEVGPLHPYQAETHLLLLSDAAVEGIEATIQNIHACVISPS